MFFRFLPYQANATKLYPLTGVAFSFLLILILIGNRQLGKQVDLVFALHGKFLVERLAFWNLDHNILKGEADCSSALMGTGNISIAVQTFTFYIYRCNILCHEEYKDRQTQRRQELKFTPIFTYAHLFIWKSSALEVCIHKQSSHDRMQHDIIIQYINFRKRVLAVTHIPPPPFVFSLFYFWYHLGVV